MKHFYLSQKNGFTFPLALFFILCSGSYTYCQNSSSSTLSALTVSTGTLTPAFVSSTTTYTVAVSNGVTSFTVTPTVSAAGEIVKVNGTLVTSGSASPATNLNAGANSIKLMVTSQDGSSTTTYSLTVTRAPTAPPNPGTSASDPANSTSSNLSPSLNLNFAGKSAWSNISPIVYYGISFVHKNKNGTQWDFLIGPYIGAQIPIKDNTSYLPALMLPGSGIQINNYFTFGNDLKVTISPFNIGVKVISGFSDSSVTILQHSFRQAIVFNYKDQAQISFQLTNGWHNLSTSSQTYFSQTFNVTNSHVEYLNVSLQGLLSNLSTTGNTPIYYVLTWQNFLTKGLNTLPNSRFLSFGLIANIDFKSGFNPAGTPEAAPFLHVR